MIPESRIPEARPGGPTLPGPHPKGCRRPPVHLYEAVLQFAGIRHRLREFEGLLDSTCAPYFPEHVARQLEELRQAQREIHQRSWLRLRKMGVPEQCAEDLIGFLFENDVLKPGPADPEVDMFLGKMRDLVRGIHSQARGGG